MLVVVKIMDLQLATNQESIMTSIRAFLLTGGLLVGLASQSQAQFSLTIGNPYGGGVAIGAPTYGYSSGYSNYSGVTPGLGYSNVSNSYANTGYLAGPGVIGGQYPVTGYGVGNYGVGNYGAVGGYRGVGGYSSGYSGVAPYNPALGYVNRPVYRSYSTGYGPYSNTVYGSRSVNVFAPFGGIIRSRGLRY